jgi:hypothetical protein
MQYKLTLGVDSDCRMLQGVKIVKNVLTKNITRNTRISGLSMTANNNFMEKCMVDYLLKKKLNNFCVHTTKIKF